MNKDIMITVRITPTQYYMLLESLVKEKKNKSDFIRESITESIKNILPKNCRKRDMIDLVNQQI